MADITQRLTDGIRLAEQQVANAQRQSDHINWSTVLETMRDARQALKQPQDTRPVLKLPIIGKVN